MFRFCLTLAVCLLSARSSFVVAETIESFTEPFRKIDLSPAEPGTISELLAHEGDRVAKGQVLAMLDHDVLQVSLEIDKAIMQSRSKFDSAKAERNLRKSRLENLEMLRVRGHANQEEVNRAQTDLAIAEANLLSTQEQMTVDALQYKKTQAMLERRTVRSPIDGILTRLHREEREFVTLSSPTVATVVQLDQLRVIFNVPTPFATNMKVGENVRLALPDSEENVEGRIEFISPITEAESATVRVKVLLNNAQGKLRSGVRCTWEMPTSQSSPLADTLSLSLAH